MPIRATVPNGSPTWIDLATSDPERAQDFYGAVFGWTFESAGPEYGGYVNAFSSGRSVAGLMHNDPQWNAPDGWTTYFHTADVKATLAGALAAGAETCAEAAEPIEVKDKGWMAVLADPAGAFLGLWQPGGHNGFEVVDEDGAPVFFQLTTRDHAGSLDFYRRVFGWNLDTVADTDEFRYSTAAFDGATLLGVMDGAAFLPQEVPSRWDFYLGADDVDKTVQVIVDHGGSVIRAAEDTPYGRLAAVADPTGAGFNLSSLES